MGNLDDAPWRKSEEIETAIRGIRLANPEEIGMATDALADILRCYQRALVATARRDVPPQHAALIEEGDRECNNVLRALRENFGRLAMLANFGEWGAAAQRKWTKSK